MTDVYVEEILSLNFIKEISYGMFENGKSVYLVAFDFDIYSNNESFLSEFTSTIESKLDEMNECAFEFFKKTMKDRFLENVLINESKKLTDFGIIEGDE